MELPLLQLLTESPLWIVRILFGLMIAILFTQSGLDKIANYSAEKAFYTEHFKDSILSGMVGLMMPVITLFETAAGLLSALGLIIYLLNGNPDLAILGMLLSCLSIIQLFFGQRVAKDYAGAAVLVPYFLLTVGGLYVFLLT